MNKYYEWKVLTHEGRLIPVPPLKQYGYDVDLYGTFPCKEIAIEELQEWLKSTDSKAPDNLTLVTFYN